MSKHFSKHTTHSYMVLGGQYGSESKGLLAGWLAETRQPTAVVCSFAPSAGHTHITSDGFRFVVTQIPIGSISKRCRGIFIGPGSIIDPVKMTEEIVHLCENQRLDLQQTEIIIHEHAAVVTPADIDAEKASGLAKIGSTLKGGSSALGKKLGRRPDAGGQFAVARDGLKGTPLEGYLADEFEYLSKLQEYGYITQIEGAQGFSLSLNHGFYPYVTSRDCTPHQTFNDCGIPWGMAKRTAVYQALRTYPIRVNNREGTSGPGYPDQKEIEWADIGINAELTTVTKLPRRVFTWSDMQYDHMVNVCGQPDGVFINFVNYVRDQEYFNHIMHKILQTRSGTPELWFGVGPAFDDVLRLPDYREWRNDPRAAKIIEFLSTDVGQIAAD